MSSSDNLPTTNRSSYTKNESAYIFRLNFFDTFPDELIIYTLSFLSPPAVAQFVSTSRRHSSITSAEHIWLPIALGIIRDNVDPNDTLVDEKFMRRNGNRFLAALGLGKTEPPRVWYRIATRLLKRVEWTLGWWLGKTDQLTKGCLWRIFIEIDNHYNRFLRMVATRVEVDESHEYNLQLPPGGPLSIREMPSDIFALELPGDDGWPSVSVEGFVPLDSRLLSRGFGSGHLSLNSQDGVDAYSPWYSARKLQDHLSHLSRGTDGWKEIAGRQWYASFSDAPYLPPLLDQLLDQREGQHARDGPVVPSIALLSVAGTASGITMETLLSIRRPSSFSRVANELVQTGIYVAPYGSRGWEYLLIRVRELTEDDFHVTWPWEGSMAVAPPDAIQTMSEPKWDSLYTHLGPFSGVVPEYPMSSEPMRVSRDHVRRGSRILEGIKIKGDPIIPGGQRDLVTFLDDPLVQPAALQEAEETFPHVSSQREDELPWPFVPRAPTTTDAIDEATYKQSYFSPERGIDIPGVMRSADSGFRYPQWTSCVVHVECKTKFTVASYGVQGAVFRKLNDWGFEINRGIV